MHLTFLSHNIVYLVNTIMDSLGIVLLSPTIQDSLHFVTRLHWIELGLL